MAAGGTGDILTGIITSLIAQGLDSYSASCLGVYIHGLASDIAVEKTGMISLLPRDILKEISSAFKLALDKIKKI